MHSIESFIIHL